MGLIKDIYSPDFYNTFSDTAAKEIPGFNRKLFIKRIFNNDFVRMEWKERMQHTTRVLHTFLPENFTQAAQTIASIIQRLQARHTGDTLAYIFLADYIAAYGLDDFDSSVQTMETVTQFISCEFAVRPFLLKYEKPMIKQMIQWTNHSSNKVRRFASEGSRPRLPWAIAIPSLKKNPIPILPILENLKNDPSEWVRKSVANNLNDIAKDHPAVVLDIAARWSGKSRETDAIVKHGCRTLLKQGHPEVLKHYGLSSSALSVTALKVLTPEVATGSHVEFSFSVKNEGDAVQTVRLEYGIYYKKAKGHNARKVFKISERILQPGEILKVHRKQSFKLITTRVFYPGQHQVSVIINGEEKAIKKFILTEV